MTTDDPIAFTPDVLADIEDLLTVSIDDPRRRWPVSEFADVEPAVALEDVHRSIAERQEYEIRGAWRAGYDYVHVHRPTYRDALASREIGEIASIPVDRLEPSNDPTPRGGPGRYVYSYDLASVPDGVIRAAVRGDLPECVGVDDA